MIEKRDEREEEEEEEIKLSGCQNVVMHLSGLGFAAYCFHGGIGQGVDAQEHWHAGDHKDARMSQLDSSHAGNLVIW